MPAPSVTIGTRGSALALWQARYIASRLQALGWRTTLQEIRTQGDRILDVPLAQIGDRGLFTRELDEAMLDGRIDLAVHSLKDLPTRQPEGIRLAAVPEREAPWDVLVAHPGYGGGLADLPPGATLATSSLRRQAQLLAWRPDLRIVSVRGNVDTRLRKLDESDWQGMLLAEAGLKRLGLHARIRERIPRDIMLPAVGQGALGVVCSEGRPDLCEMLRTALNHRPTEVAALAERAFLRRLEGGCQVPIGAHATLEGETLRLEGCIVALDGAAHVRQAAAGRPEEADRIGTGLAETVLAAGGDVILAGIRT